MNFWIVGVVVAFVSAFLLSSFLHHQGRPEDDEEALFLLQDCYAAVVEEGLKASSPWKHWSRLLPHLMIASLMEDDKFFFFYESVNSTLFALAMEEWSKYHVAKGVHDELPQKDCSCFADVGGGSGFFLSHLRGGGRKLLIDSSDEALRVARARDDNLECHKVNMFNATQLAETPLPQCSCVVLKNVVSDYNETQSRSLLETISQSMQVGARLFVLDHFLIESSSPGRKKKMERFRHQMDVMMRLLLRGQQYTVGQMKFLAADVGLNFVSWKETKTPVVVMEFVKKEAPTT